MKWLKNISENLIAKSASPLAEEGLIDKDVVKQAVIHNDPESRKQISRAHKDALKGSIAGASMVGGFFNPFGFLGDLGITTTSTLADTAVEGNTKQLSKDLIINLGSDLVGHGIGTEMHEHPDVPNYGKKGTGPILKEGMTIAIEPMLNLGTREIYLLEDDWTIITQDGLPSAHFEHTVVVTKDGYQILTGDDNFE